MIARPHRSLGTDDTASDAPPLSVSAREAAWPPAPPSEANLQLMRRLVDEAAGAAERFESSVNGAALRESRARSASMQLQERLRLGARLLQAQQYQIERLEKIVAELQTVGRSAEQALARLDARIGRRLDQLRITDRRR